MEEQITLLHNSANSGCYFKKWCEKNIIMITIVSTLIMLSFYNELYAMGGKFENMNKDKGVIGDKRTRAEKKVYYDQKRDTTYIFPSKNRTFVTPVVIDDVAKFKFDGEYAFDFLGIGWSYRVQSGCLDIEQKNRLGWVVELQSPDKKDIIATKELDLPAEYSLNTVPTEEVVSVLPKAAKDPFIGEERILATKQAIRWVLSNDLGNYSVINNATINYATEIISNKEFVKTEVDISDGSRIRKCIIWGINLWGYRNKPEERKMIVLMIRVITEPDNLSSALSKAHTILKTLSFKNNQCAYSDLK